MPITPKTLITPKKKLIEVALPLKAINAEASREKSIRHGHPSTLHLWWARRPLAAARAVIWSSLVDDPSSHPERFLTEAEQDRERQRLFAILEKLIKWENSNDPEILTQARAEILHSTDSVPPIFLDPFAGGGALPLEAQRLGLEAHAHDLNPVAVMINKAMIEIPPRFAGQRPVHPAAQTELGVGTPSAGAAGLAEDLRYYGQWMKEQARKKIGHLYPKAELPKDQGGGTAPVVAWIWARTVTCPNPACGCEVPLVRSFILSKKKGKEAWIEPIFEDRKTTYKVCYEGAPKIDGTVSRTGAQCPCCGTPIAFSYIRREAQAGRMNAQLMAVVAEGKRGRIYISPDEEQTSTAHIEKPDNYPTGNLSTHFTGGSCVPYGFNEFHKLFTPRQLTALTTFSALVSEAQKRAEIDAAAAGLTGGAVPLSEGGTGPRAYSEAIAVYLAFLVDKMAAYHSSICSWDNSVEKMRNMFARQAIPMTWDYAEANPFSNSTGCFDNMLEWIYKCLIEFPAAKRGIACQHDAQSDCGLRNVIISTDPPYYDNISYAGLSDFFYIWMRQTLSGIYPELFQTMLTPKAEELIAAPYRFDNDTNKARDFFEDGMLCACRRLYEYARDDIPVTIYYAYKQSETKKTAAGQTQTTSTGWETILTALIQAGFTITGTWPIRTEMLNRSVALAANALASSIVLVCRKRPKDASICARYDFITALKRELKPALRKLYQSNIAPVDLAQSAIGPGIAVFSRFSSVLEADGTPMTVRSAIQLINQEISSISGQNSAVDSDTRFCIDFFTQYAYNNAPFGDADILARATGTSITRLKEENILYAVKGDVRLLTRDELPKNISPSGDTIWLLTQRLIRDLETGGIVQCAQTIAPMLDSAPEEAKELAYRLYRICERNNWTHEALAYNDLVTSWPDIQIKAAEIRSEKLAGKPEQTMIFYDRQ